MNILVLYDPHSTFIGTVWDHLLSFKLHLPHRVFYTHATPETRAVGNFSEFDVVMIHYTVRLAYKRLSREHESALRRYPGLKVVFLQDEYEYTEITRQAIERLGADVVFTCVPPSDIGKVYDPKRFPRTAFVNNLTGYVPAWHRKPEAWRPLRDRKYLIGYRGRDLPFWLGNLAREKMYIGERMRQECEKRNLRVDIEWRDSKRRFGEDWFEFLSACRATLGTESGSNIFDETGALRERVEDHLRRRPRMPYSEIFEEILAPHEGKVPMNQISPRIFEAASVGTALVLFEGKYSDIVLPDVHYIPLRKDFSNVDEVLSKLHDDRFLTRMIERMYADTIASGRYSYAEFMKTVSAVIEHAFQRKLMATFPNVSERSDVQAMAGNKGIPVGDERSVMHLTPLPTYIPSALSSILGAEGARNKWLAKLWNALPEAARAKVKPIVLRIVAAYRACLRG